MKNGNIPVTEFPVFPFSEDRDYVVWQNFDRACDVMTKVIEEGKRILFRNGRYSMVFIGNI